MSSSHARTDAPILVTGGAGFIGSCYVRRAIASGRRVVNLDALTYAGTLTRLASVADDPLHRFVHGDVRDSALLARLFDEERPDAVVHFAAESHVDRSINDARPFIDTNVGGTTALLGAALAHWDGLSGADREAFRFLHISTDEVFGTLGPTGAFTETTPYNPRSPYAASKAASDHLVRSFGLTYGLPVLITNCSNNYGPFQFPEKLIPLTFVRAIGGRPLPVYGDGSNVRDWIHVEDSCAAFEGVLSRGVPGESYCIGADAERTNLDTVRDICRLLDGLTPKADGGRHEDQITFVTDRPGHDFRYATDCAKARRTLGWSGGRPFAEGLLQTVRWYLENRAWWEPILAGVYDGERLGLRGRAA
ncbi:MAG: dTDP-glucose 4,6-dehydratase [Rhodospirillales bacterium]